jgi:adenylate cyclase
MEDPLIARLLAYLPPDRAESIFGDVPLPPTQAGAVLFSDISGFTPLTEAVIARYGARRGGEQFTDRLNAVYDALITEVERFGGSIVGFAGDALFVWFAGDDGACAVTTALNMQRAMAQFARVVLPDGETVALAMKAAVSSGILRRFQVGDEQLQCFDVMAGEVMERVATCEGVATRGEIAVDAETARQLGSRLVIRERRPLPPGSIADAVLVVEALHDELPARPRAAPALRTAEPERLRPWLIPEVGRRIVSGQDVFLTELRPATALFARFSGLDFEHDEAAPGKLDGYVRWLQRIVARLEGIVVQLTLGEKGSYFYAAWGAPIAHDDDTMRACTAALELVNPPPDVAAFITSTQIGIANGTMRTGAYGNRRRRTYGVLGDETNLAARLMTKAGSNEILISSHAARRQMDMFDLAPLPPLRVKGKKEPVPVFRLMGRRQHTRTLAGGGRHAMPMVGRHRERTLALERLELARTRRGQVIAISGDAGMGKSRLVVEVVREAAAAGFAGFAGDCPVLAREASYSVWIPIWRAFFHVPPDADAAAALAIVERQLAAYDASLVARAPLLGPLLNLELADNELTRTLEPKVRISSREGLIVECVRHRARVHPLLFVLEDCHWIDEASRRLLATLVQAVPRLQVAIVVAHRPVKPGDIFGPNEAALEHLVDIVLGDLPGDEARQLVELKLAETFVAHAAPAALVELITSRAAGNPFFIEEVVNLLRSRGTDPGDLRALETLELPESLHSLVLGRIDQLNEDTQTTLKVASVIGRVFHTATLFGVHPLERVRMAIPAQLAEMHTRDLAQPEPGGEEAYLFRHIVIQEVAYECLPFGLRATIHGAIGGYIEQAAGPNLRPWIDLLAFHYDRSNCDEKKARYLVAAGDAARAAYALPSAISYYERALAVVADGARIDVLSHLGDVLELSGKWNDAFNRYGEARALAATSGSPAQRAAIAGAIGDLHRKRGEFAEAEVWLRRARQENAEIGNEEGVALMLHLEATLAAQMGNFARASELYRQALAIRERVGDEAGAAKTLNNLGIVARSQGDVDAALVLYECSLAIRRRLNDRREIANSLNNLGFTLRYRKEFGRARELLEESVQMNRTVGDRWSTANALSSLAELALDTGDADLAARCLQESIGINRELGDRRALAFLLEGFGRLGCLKSEHAVAWLFFAAARILREKIGAPLEPADAERLATVIELARQEVAPAAREDLEAEGRVLPLSDVLDRAANSFWRPDEHLVP